MQQTLAFKIAATILLVLPCIGFFGVLFYKTSSIETQRQSLQAALSNQNLVRGDEHAVSMRNSGEIHFNGRTYGGKEFLTPNIPLFDAEGNLIRVPMLVESLLAEQYPKLAPTWLLDEPSTTALVGFLCTVWFLLIVWTAVTIPFLLTVIGTAIPVAICAWLEKQQLMLGVAGIGLLTFTFLLLTRVALLVLNQPWQISAVAHTVIKEASRRGLALVFIVLLLVVLPLLPLLLDPASPLRFRIQSYISWSMGLTFSIAAVMTLFFSCASVAFEIRDRQIWQLMTKPLARLNYLLGKWVGVMALNLVILSVAGACTFTFIQYLRTLPVANNEVGLLDLRAVYDEVLTARIGTSAEIPRLDPEQLQLRVNQIIKNDPELSQLDYVPGMKRDILAKQIQAAYTAGQRSIPAQDTREYMFTGLQAAKQYASTLMLRYKFYILRDDEHLTFRAGFEFNDDPNTRVPSTFVPSISHTLAVPSAYIRDDGTLKVSIFNFNSPSEVGQAAINWEEGNIELLYKAGTFQGNFIRAMLTIWIKLAFLAALGICCATFLSFPVACLLAFTVFAGGMLGPYLAESLEYYGHDTTGLDWSDFGMVLQVAFEWVTANIAGAVVFLLSSFGEYRPTQKLVEGRLIEWSSVGIGFLKLAVLWSGLAMLVGYTVLRKRQLAIYSGQG